MFHFVCVPVFFSYVDHQRLMSVIAPDACDSLYQHVCVFLCVTSVLSHNHCVEPSAIR